MKKQLFVAAAILAFGFSAHAQRFATKNGVISFDATSPAEDISAKTTAATGAIEAASGKVMVSANVKGFHFKRALMEEHFNENYIEAAKYPKASFEGQIENWNAEMLKKEGAQNVSIKGKLTMHGVTKEIVSQGTVTVKAGAIVAAKTAFQITAADYGIAIPSAVKDKIAKNIKIEVNFKDMKKM